ncbi:hypothetical protein JXE04_00970 [Patescibacteria group bacterium]|nr:hypothetical protein [Patescibacteria group bacterium]
MTENNLLKQLKSLKNIKPEDSWLKSNREILLAQISNSGAQELSAWKRLIIDTRSFMSTVSKPAISFASLLLVLVGASAFSYLAFSKTKPNDSLYIARIISEKAKLTTVFNEEEREKMEVRFATNHAEDITEVLASKVVDENNQDQVAKLNENFNKEINTVRTRIVALSNSNKNVESRTADIVSSTTSEDETIMTASNEKDKAGVQLNVRDEIKTDGMVDSTAVATDTPELSSEAEADLMAENLAAPEDIKGAEEILDEAQSLFDNKEYDSALNKLKEVKELMK